MCGLARVTMSGGAYEPPEAVYERGETDAVMVARKGEDTVMVPVMWVGKGV